MGFLLIATAAAVTVTELNMKESASVTMDEGECVAFKVKYDPSSVDYEGKPSTGPNAGMKVEVDVSNGKVAYMAVGYSKLWYEGASTPFLVDPEGIQECMSDFDDYSCWGSTIDDVKATQFKDGDCSVSTAEVTSPESNSLRDELAMNSVGSYDGAVGCITAKQDVYVYVKAEDGSSPEITITADAVDNALTCKIASNILLVVGAIAVVSVCLVCLCIYCLRRRCRNKDS
jgi:hypothetical protein